MDLVKQVEKYELLEDFLPYEGRLVVQEDEITDRTSSGLYIPTKQTEVIATTGVVIACGTNVFFCNNGDRVCYARYSGTKFTWKGKEYRLMNEEDLLGKEVQS